MCRCLLAFTGLYLLFGTEITAAEKNGLTKKEQEQFERLQQKMGAYKTSKASLSTASVTPQDPMSKISASMMMGILGNGPSIEQINQMTAEKQIPKIARETTAQRKKRIAAEKKTSRETNNQSSLLTAKSLPKADSFTHPTQREPEVSKEVRDAMQKIVGSKRDGNLEKFLLTKPKEELGDITDRILELHRCMKGVDWRDISPQIMQFVEKVSERCLAKVIKNFQRAKDCTFDTEVWKKTLLQLSSIDNEDEIIELASRIEGDVERYKENEKRLPLAQKAMHEVVGVNQEDKALEEFFLQTDDKNLEVLPAEMRKLWHCMRGVPWVNAGKYIIGVAKKIDADMFCELNDILSCLVNYKFLTVEWEGWLQKLAISNNNKILEVAKNIVSDVLKKGEQDKKIPVVLEAMGKIPFAKMDDKLKEFLLSLAECDICITAERLADLISYMPGVRWEGIADSVLALVRRMDLETLLAFNTQMEKMKDNKADSMKWEMWFRSLEKFQGKQIVEVAEMMVWIQDMLEDKKHVCIRNFSDRLGKLPLDLWGGLKAHLEEAKAKLSSSNLLVGLLAAFNSYAGITADKMKVKAVNIE